MVTSTPGGKVRYIAPEKIERNPENPRLFFRSGELSSLLESIRQYGVQVPITVYQEGEHYTLIDGERRWRCANKLNLKTIPALIQPKPSALENLLLMFNIHALREQWDYVTIANKLPAVIQLFVQERGYRPNEIELSQVTGLSRGQIRRCQLILDLPAEYREQLLAELQLPKSKQQLSEDFFIEMERALKAVRRRAPEVVPDLNAVRDTLIHKFRDGVISNITDFRKLSKIATSLTNQKIDVEPGEAHDALVAIFAPNKVSISEMYSRHFEFRYDERKVLLSVYSIVNFLEDDKLEVGSELREALRELLKTIKHVLEA
jgi:ParB/RepB/Spo0J family partition protein